MTTSSGTATVTLPTDEQILITRAFDAPKHLVYKAYTTPDLVRRWWSGKRGQVMSAEIDLRVGGRYRFAMQPPEGDLFHLTGEFREVDPPSRLVYTFVWEPPDPDDRETVVTLSFRDEDGSTEVNFTQGVFATEQRRALHEQGWTESFERLQELLSAR